MTSLDYLSKAELQPSVNRLMGLFNKLSSNQPLDEVATKAIIAILLDVIDKCDKAKDEYKNKQVETLMKNVSPQIRTLE